MIIILSSEVVETTTDQVIDWLDSLGGEWARLNGEDLTSDEPYELRFDSHGCDAVFHLGSHEIRPDEVRAVWFRRWHQLRDFPTPGVEAPELRNKVDYHLGRELRALTEAVCHLLGHAEWLTTPAETRLAKLRVLQLAAHAGLAVPATAVTNRKRYLQAFKDRHRRIITKCTGDVDVFRHAGRGWGMYTAELTQADIDAAPEVFFPTLVQERLDKAYEVRTFYLDDEFHSMAIFSQNDPRTESDFRRYNRRRPNRNVPYCLPSDTVAALRRFVEAAELSTGSIDFVRTPEGRHVFLEVNPGGQFGMVSQPCNYFLEKKVAERLIRMDRRDSDAKESK